MPAGWQQLDAGAFAVEARKLLKAQPGPEAAHVKEVVRHAWTRFLNDGQFVATGDWLAVRSLAGTFVPERRVLVDGDTPEAQEASREQVEAYLAALRSRLRTRITEQPGTLRSLDFDALGVSSEALLSAGLSEDDRAGWYAAWMEVNPWQALSLDDQASLYACLSADAVDKHCVSVRWTGTLHPPANGDYTFEQLRTFYTDGAMKLWIAGELVLDSPGVCPTSDDRSAPVLLPADDPRFRSSPVSLSGGEPVDFRLEYVHDMTKAKLTTAYPYPMGLPVAVLLWRSSAVDRQIVPSSEFTPPEGFGEGQRRGLKAEYYADAEFTETRGTRLDPAVDFIWHSGPMLPKYSTQREAIVAACLPKLTSPTYLASRTGEDASRLANRSLGRFAEGMPASQRLELLRVLTQQPGLLGQMDYDGFLRQFRAFHLLPGREPMDLMVAWSEARPQPRTRLGYYRGWQRHQGEADSYAQLNYEYPWSLGGLLCQALVADTEEIWKTYLELPNGECNLTLAYGTIFAAKLSRGRELDVGGFLDETLQDEKLTGDRRVSWLLARAFNEEAAAARSPRPGGGMVYLEEALAAAESPEYRFWALQEIVARHLACDRCDQAVSLIKSLKDQFTEEAQQEAMAQWLAEAERLRAYYVGVRQEARRGAVRAHLAELRRRAERAESRGDDALVRRYRKMIEKQEDLLGGNEE